MRLIEMLHCYRIIIPNQVDFELSIAINVADEINQKGSNFIWSELIETRPTIAIFEFLKIREPLSMLSFIGIKLAPMEYA